MLIALIWLILIGYQFYFDSAVEAYSGRKTIISGMVTEQLSIGSTDFFRSKQTELEIEGNGKYLLLTDEIPTVQINDVVELEVLEDLFKKERKVAINYKLIKSGIKIRINGIEKPIE